MRRLVLTTLILLSYPALASSLSPASENSTTLADPSDPPSEGHLISDSSFGYKNLGTVWNSGVSQCDPLVAAVNLSEMNRLTPPNETVPADSRFGSRSMRRSVIPVTAHARGDDAGHGRSTSPGGN